MGVLTLTWLLFCSLSEVECSLSEVETSNGMCTLWSVSLSMVHFKLIDINEQLVECWGKTFKDISNVEVIHGDIFKYPSSALVSPANSFGAMNGGIDFAISKNLGWHIEKDLKKIIREKFFGELLVGQSTIVPTDHSDFPYLISAPTMRNPMTILHTPNVYLAMKAILTLVQFGTFDNGDNINSVVNSVAIPGLGTGIGQVPPMICARQMRIAWEDIMNEKFRTEDGWKEMRSNYAYFYTSRKEDLKYDIE
jgi:O-acetyl-ADP-ribose deacetylase (regulator of RNase III)